MVLGLSTPYKKYLLQKFQNWQKQSFVGKAYFKGEIRIKVIHDWCFFPHIFNNAKKKQKFWSST